MTEEICDNCGGTKREHKTMELLGKDKEYCKNFKPREKKS